MRQGAFFASAFILLVLLSLLSLGAPSVAASTMEITMRMSPGHIVEEQVVLRINSTQAYDAFEYQTASKPLSVAYDGTFHVRDQNGTTVITFDKAIHPGENTLTFTLLDDGLIDSFSGGKVLRSAFDARAYDSVALSLSLPKGTSLSRDPAATPAPDRITSDGQSIILGWDLAGGRDIGISVFYEGKDSTLPLILVFVAAATIIAATAILLSRRRMRATVHEMLSEDEQRVVAALRKGATKQSQIAQDLGFSKSKMSKVLRKLEQKGLIAKTPWFKTNKLTLKKIR